MSKRDTSWADLFKSKNIVKELTENNVAYISSDEIKEITKGGEARLLTKFDTRESRPNLLKEHGCTIIPVKNGMYAIAVGDGYHDLEECDAAIRFSSSKIDDLQTLPNDCKSESQAIDAIFISGILSDFLDEGNLVQTMRGRLRTKEFNCQFSGKEFNIDGVQVEVDGGFEGDKVYIIEAKTGVRDNFIVRQLYYPYRMWLENGVQKEIVPLFLIHSNGEFTLYEYKFNDVNDYNSIELVKNKSYTLFKHEAETEPVSFKQTAFDYIFADKPIRNENRTTPFPQANDVRKVIDVILGVESGFSNKEDIAQHHDFDPRQSDYYGGAATYLGFLDHENDEYTLTEDGVKFISLNPDERRLMVLNAMLVSPVINKSLSIFTNENRIPSSDEVADIIAEYREELGVETCKRRAGTVINWIRWIDKNN